MQSQRDAAYAVLSGLRLESGHSWGATAAPFQKANAMAILDVDSPVRQHWLTLPRGARKSTDLAGILLAILATQAPPLARCYVGASDEDQAAELIDAARGLVHRTDELRDVFEVRELVIANRLTGASVTALPMDASAMGLRAYMIVLDEITNWPETKRAKRFWGVLTSGARKLAECRLVVITNAGTPEHWAAARRSVALKSPHWRVSEVPGPLEWLTAADLEVLKENSETPSEFDRLHLNLWVSAEDRLASMDDILACTALPESPSRMPAPPRPGPAYAVGVDLGTVKDRTAVVVAHLVDDRKIVLDDLRVWTPRPGAPVPHDEVEQHIAAVAEEYSAVVSFDPSEARGMMQRLTAVGVRVEQFVFSQASTGKLALTLFNALRDHEIALPRDDALIEELATVRLLHPGPGLWRIDHDSSRHDDRVIAVALAAQWLLEHGANRPSWVFPPLPEPETVNGLVTLESMQRAWSGWSW
jgi:phage terminase large subunit-like protein